MPSGDMQLFDISGSSLVIASYCFSVRTSDNFDNVEDALSIAGFITHTQMSKT